MKVLDVRKKNIEALKKAGIAEPVLDCDIIFAHVMNVERHKVVLDVNRRLNQEEIREIDALIARRCEFEPVAYILNRKEFYAIDFYVDENVLIPRPETELLVDLALYHAGRNARILDLCTGSGAIAITLKHNRHDLVVYASDISEKALNVAKRNAMDLLGPGLIHFDAGDLLEPFGNTRFDIIVSNPPYVNKEISQTLQKDLQFEPENALYAEDKGREVIYTIIKNAHKYLNQNGILLLEIGSEMSDDVRVFAEQHGYEFSLYKDYAQLPRAVLLTYSGSKETI